MLLMKDSNYIFILTGCGGYCLLYSLKINILAQQKNNSVHQKTELW